MSDNRDATHGLRANTLSLHVVSVIGVASAAPAYSLAAALGLIAAIAGVKAPAILLLAFPPMAAIAIAFDQFNRIDPDCGTSFSWVTRAFGPTWGWFAGWAILTADVVVMASLAQVSAQYSLALIGQDAARHPLLAQGLGALWIAAMTGVCYRGIAFSARLQTALLLVELLVLAALAGLMLHAAYGGQRPDALLPTLAWFWPGGLPVRALLDALGLAIFIYWGWDTAVNVNAESHRPRETPGRAAILATVALLGIFALSSAAALAWAGPQFLVAHQDDVLAALGTQVFAAPWDRLVPVVVLTSAVAATQTTILPAARTALSMAQRNALPTALATVHPRHLTPSMATVWTGVLSTVWYLALAQLTPAVVAASLTALNLLVAFYFGLTGLACAWYFRRDCPTPRQFLLRVAAPLLGGGSLLALMVYLIAAPPDGQASAMAVALAVGIMLLGAPVLVWQRRLIKNTAISVDCD